VGKTVCFLGLTWEKRGSYPNHFQAKSTDSSFLKLFNVDPVTLNIKKKGEGKGGGRKLKAAANTEGDHQWRRHPIQQAKGFEVEGRNIKKPVTPLNVGLGKENREKRKEVCELVPYV